MAVVRPVSEAWFAFAESSFPQTAPHPPHPRAAEGLSPTLSWQPLSVSLCSFCNPDLRDGHGSGAVLSPPFCKNPRAGGGGAGEPELPGRPWGRGPSTGSTSG